MDWTLFAYVFLAFFIGAIISFLLSKIKQSKNELAHKEMQTRMESDYNNLEKRFNELQDERKDLELKNVKVQDKLNQLFIENQRLAHTNESLLQQKEEQAEAQKALYKESQLRFEQLANKILEDKSERFSKQNQNQIEQILKPLNQDIQSFKKQVEEVYHKESKERHTLESKIKELVTLNQQISQEAHNLTQALKGDKKMQGNWGEMILESILEYAGLRRDHEYVVQHSFTDETGKRKQPDILVKYPDGRTVIIDSKVSLVDYDKYCQSDDAEEQKIYLQSHVRALQKHIDMLSSKSYDDFDKALDFVMLFVPIEPAYLLALQADPDLWQYAYQRRIILISPTNLMAALKMTADIWKREHQSQHAQKIAKRGGLLVDKLLNFFDDFQSILKHLEQAQQAYDNAYLKFSSGRGNLLWQARKLKTLGVSTKKEIPTFLEEE